MYRDVIIRVTTLLRGRLAACRLLRLRTLRQRDKKSAPENRDVNVRGTTLL